MEEWSSTIAKPKAKGRSAPQADREEKAYGLMRRGWFCLTIFHDSELGGVVAIVKALSELPELEVWGVETNRDLGMTSVSLFVVSPIALREVMSKISCVASVNWPEDTDQGVHLSLDGYPTAMVTVSG